MSSNNDSQSTTTTQPAPEPQTPLLLPSSEGTSGSGSMTQITVGGTAVSLVDELGPMVVNSNGTLSRIANWPNMTPEERARTLRVLGARNKLRLANEEQKLREKDSAGGAEASQ